MSHVGVGANDRRTSQSVRRSASAAQPRAGHHPGLPRGLPLLLPLGHAKAGRRARGVTRGRFLLWFRLRVLLFVGPVVPIALRAGAARPLLLVLVIHAPLLLM